MFMEKTPVALAVLAACAVVFILINNGPESGRIGRAVKYGCYDRALIYEGQWWRMVTVGFTHIQPWHLAMNLYALYNLSPLEGYFGHGWFALILFGGEHRGISVFRNPLVGRPFGRPLRSDGGLSCLGSILSLESAEHPDHHLHQPCDQFHAGNCLAGPHGRSGNGNDPDRIVPAAALNSV